MAIKIGDKVMTGVFVAGEFVPMHPGIVIAQTPDGSISDVDVMSLHGGRPWIHKEITAHLQPIPQA